MKTPVAFLIFKRPETTQKVFEAIRQAKPKKLLVVADGPCQERPEEAEKCALTREIIEQVDWDCEVLKNYADVNLGCGKRVSSGLDWVFEKVEEAIILEDDCLPHPSFFPFCEAMLKRYRDDERVMHITGTNILLSWKSNTQSYHFSYHAGIWGWASWRRAWQHYDFDMNLWVEPEIKKRVLDVMADPDQYKRRKPNFDAVFEKKVDTWDFQWAFARLVQSGLSIVPAVNLVANIGFDRDATHTNAGENYYLAKLPVSELSFPIKLHKFVAADRDFERQDFAKNTSRKDILMRLKNQIKYLNWQLPE